MMYDNPKYDEWEDVEFRVDDIGTTSEHKVPYLVVSILNGTHEGRVTKLYRPREGVKSHTQWVDAFGTDLEHLIGGVVKATAMPNKGPKQYYCKFGVVKMPSDMPVEFNLDEIPF